ncbi:MAG TPA: hypothetical protein VK509_07945 [Polyangiales bacterium]|nr:hypothetical protein [Polyangiales bacterium]
MRRTRRRRDSRALLVQALWLLSMGHVLASGFVRAQASQAETEAHATGLGFNWVRLPGAESCVSASTLMNRIEAHVGRLLFVRAGEAALSIDGYVRPVPGPPSGWAVALEVSDASGRVLGHRDLDVLVGADCSVVASAAELIFDLTVDPDGILGTGMPLAPETRQLLDQLLRGEEIDPDPTKLPVPVRAPVTTAARAPSPEAARAPTQRVTEPEASSEAPAPSTVWLHASALGSLGDLPGLGWGVGVRATMPVLQSWLLELSFAEFPERHRALTDGDGAEAGFATQLVGLGLCPLRPSSAFALCAGAEYGRQYVDPSGLAGGSAPANKALLDVFAYGLFRVSLFGPVSLRASATVLAPLLRNDYRYGAPGGAERFFRMTVVAARAELGLGLGL